MFYPLSVHDLIRERIRRVFRLETGFGPFAVDASASQLLPTCWFSFPGCVYFRKSALEGITKAAAGKRRSQTCESEGQGDLPIR